jgi:hypothetical protein
VVLPLVVAVTLAAFAATYAAMWLVQGVLRVDEPLLRWRPGVELPRRFARPLGPDDDPAFLRELRSRIDRGPFRRRPDAP